MTYRFSILIFLAPLAAYLTSCSTGQLYQRSDFENAQAEQREGRFERAILYYRSYLEGPSSKPHGEEAQYRLGESYYLSGQMVFAQRELQNYRRMYPDGRFAGEADAFLQEIDKAQEQVATPAPKRSLKDLQSEVGLLEQQVRENPKNVALSVRLAEVYLDLGEPTLAEKTLDSAQANTTTYAESQEVRRVQGRLEKLRQRQPVYATDLYGNPGPLRVQEARGELRRDVMASSRPQRNYYVVTGFVDNKSGNRYSNVRVQVEVYQFGGNLIATETVPVGTIAPWGRRAFTAKVRLESPADDQVWRFECRLDY